VELDERVAAFRREFPQLEERIYFNHAAHAPVPRSVVLAAAQGLEVGSKVALGGEHWNAYHGTEEEVRRLAACLVGVEAGQIAFVGNTSAALSLVACSIPWKPGDNIVSARVENAANLAPWLNLRDLGVEVRLLPAGQDDRVDLVELRALTDRRTRLVALSAVQYATGQRLDLASVVAFCRPRGILVSVDAVQALGAVPLNAKALGVNFLAAGGHKWLMGLTGMGIFYVDELATGLVRTPVLGEKNIAGETGARERDPELRLFTDAGKFEAGEPSLAGLYGLGQALRNVEACGLEEISQRLYRLTEQLAEGLRRLDCRVISPRGDEEWSGIVTFEPPGLPAADVVHRLGERAITTAVRRGRVRVSPHYYNTPGEIDTMLTALREIMAS